jgi:hypothetical protein
MHRSARSSHKSTHPPFRRSPPSLTPLPQCPPPAPSLDLQAGDVKAKARAKYDDYKERRSERLTSGGGSGGHLRRGTGSYDDPEGEETDSYGDPLPASDEISPKKSAGTSRFASLAERIENARQMRRQSRVSETSRLSPLPPPGGDTGGLSDRLNRSLPAPSQQQQAGMGAHNKSSSLSHVPTPPGAAEDPGGSSRGRRTRSTIPVRLPSVLPLLSCY